MKCGPRPASREFRKGEALVATRVTILGSTGSIGRSTLDVIRRNPGRFEVTGLAAHSDIEVLAEQIKEFQPAQVAVHDETAGRELESRHPGPEILVGPGSVEALAGMEVDVVLCAIVGAAGLKAVIRAIDGCGRLALANKEPLVMAGGLITELARARKVPILPVDSEHSAIFQCLEGHRASDVHRIHLTASGGPFYGRSHADLGRVTPAQATKHPNWDMGAKISVDSATLMNKGLEVIEAMWLFSLPLEKIAVIIHPQSIVHSMVEFIDGAILAHLGAPDMRLPIQFALTWPERVESPVDRLDLAALREITFAAPDFGQFPCLAHALEAARCGGTAPTVLNAANEVAVAAFCADRIPFLRIAEVVEGVMETSTVVSDLSLDTILLADREARERAEALVGAAGAKTL